MATGAERVGWLYQARRVATQANVAGGAVIVDISLATGQLAKLIGLYAINSGTNTLGLRIVDEDNANGQSFGQVASGAARDCTWPNIGNATTTANIGSSENVLLGPGQKLSVYQSGAGAQNDTMTIAITLLLYNVSTDPTWDKSRSTNAADVSLAASTISAANTSQAVVVNPP